MRFGGGLALAAKEQAGAHVAVCAVRGRSQGVGAVKLLQSREAGGDTSTAYRVDLLKGGAPPGAGGHPIPAPYRGLFTEGVRA